MRVMTVRNVQEAVQLLMKEDFDTWRNISPRGAPTIEHRGPVTTEFLRPTERVLFIPERDANPFFHFMESLWILAGRRDVEFLAQYNSQMRKFTDDGKTYHGAYGHRIRKHFEFDQLETVIGMLEREPATRRAVITMWNPMEDLGVDSNDIPCNDMIFFKARDRVLDMTVLCRSNDAILGAYGANAVHFSVLHEFVALAIGHAVGTYRQVSDSFHIYTGSEPFERLKTAPVRGNPYRAGEASPYRLMKGQNWRQWLVDCETFCMAHNTEVISAMEDPFWSEVAHPIAAAWDAYKSDAEENKSARTQEAIDILEECRAWDWARACIEWLERRTYGA